MPESSRIHLRRPHHCTWMGGRHTYTRPDLLALLEARTRELEQACARLRTSEEKYRSFVDSTPDPIFNFGRDLRYLFVNGGFARPFGKSPEEIMGLSPLDLFAPADAERRLAVVRRVFETGQPLEIEVRVDATDGPRTYLTVASPLRDEQGQVWSVSCISKEITERKKAEAALLQAKEAAEAGMKAKSEFLANMSHEIRTPLHALLGFTDLMERSPDPVHLEAIRTAGRGLLTLLNDILDLSRLEADRLPLEPGEVGVGELLLEVARIFHARIQEKGLAFTLDVADSVPACVLLDETRLRQILVNLVGNAVKFTHQGGIALRVQAIGPPEALTLSFQVADTGIGIPPEERARIFEAFHQQEGQSTRRYGGTGLGLAISLKLAALMGGELGVESEPGAGSRFTLTLPGVRALPGDPEVAPSAREAPLEVQPRPRTTTNTGPLILVVDDTAANLSLLDEILDRAGYRSVLASSGPQALAFSAMQKPDLVLLDVLMPGMDGLEVCRRLKADPRTRTIPVLFLTARTLPEDLLRGFEAGGADYLTKPFRAEELLVRIRTHLDLARAREEVRTLRGYLPTCASCKKIRDEAGTWLPMETYLASHTEAQCSHSLCPDCHGIYFPRA
jgi:PAS domain S-box-containing protein